MALISKMAVLVLSAAAVWNVQASAVVEMKTPAPAQTAVQYQQLRDRTAAMSSPSAAAPAASAPAVAVKASPVPEPGHYTLLLVGLALLLLFGRRNANRVKPWRKN